MKLVCELLGLARSNVHALGSRPASWTDGRTQRTPRDDQQLLSEIRSQITDLPSYGYRRACALVNRKRTSAGMPRVNPKRVYRVMASHGLLLPKAPRRPQSSRAHTGTVSVQASDTRWCSVSVYPCPLDDVDGTTLRRPGAQASGFVQRCGSNSSMRLFGWLGSRSRTSRS